MRRVSTAPTQPAKPKGLILFPALAAFLLSACCTAPLDHTECHVVTDPVCGLEVDVAAGDVSVVGSASTEVQLEARVYGEALRLDRELDGGVLRLRSVDEGVCVGCRIDLVLRLPAGARVAVKTGSGDVRLDAIAGDARVETGSGDVSVHTFGGDALVLSTGSGDIDAAELWSLEVDAETGSGDVGLAFVEAPERVRSTTGSGDQELRLPCAAYDVETHTGSGDVRVDGIQVDSSAPRRLELETGSGDISVVGF